MAKNKKKKVMFIASTGGHLNELFQLQSLFEYYDYHIVTEKTSTNLSLKKKFCNRISYVVYGTKDHKWTYLFKLFINCWIELFIFIKTRPKYIVTTGAHISGPMCCIGKIFGSKIIFIETFANSSSKTATGKIVYLFADLFIVQWESMLELYPKAKFYGSLF